MSGPSDKAVEWARLHHPDTPVERVERIARFIHTPALGLDRSVCLRDVVGALRGEWARGRLSNYSTQQDAADFIESEFTNEH